MDIPYPLILPIFFSMDANPDYNVEFPPFLAASPRILSDTPPSPVALPTTNTSGFGHPNAYDAFMADELEQPDGVDMATADIPLKSPTTKAPETQLPAFLDLIRQATITTDLLLVSFIPDRIKPEAFTKLMDSITSTLVSSSVLQQARPPGYKRPGFEEFFIPKPPLWMILYHAAEQHGSFLLHLPISLTFSAVGGPNGLQPPRYFTAQLHKRICLVQAVPSHFNEVFKNSPQLAFWRGFGADLSAGHHFVLASAIEAHTEKAFRACKAAGELDHSALHFSYLSLHYVNIQAEVTGPKPNRTKGKGTTSKPPERHSWLECFVVTVSTIPVGRDSIAFQALLPPEAPFGTKLHPITLFGWRGEVASHLTLFRSWIYSPDPSLLIPLPTMRFTALRPGYSLPSLCEGLKKDYQTLEGVYFCFVQRGTTDTLFLVTDGRALSSTPSLRAISYGVGMLDPDMPGMGDQRNFYRHFNQVIAPTVSGRGKAASQTNPTAAPRPSTRTATPMLTYAAATQSPSHLETSLRTFAQQETRMVIHELSTTLSQEASSMVSNAMAPVREELRQAKAEIETLKGELALHSATSKSTLQIVQHHATTLQAQRAKDLEMQRLLYTTMQSVGLPLPEGADAILAPPPKRRHSPSPDTSPMEASHE